MLRLARRAPTCLVPEMSREGVPGGSRRESEGGGGGRGRGRGRWRGRGRGNTEVRTPSEGDRETVRVSHSEGMSWERPPGESRREGEGGGGRWRGRGRGRWGWRGRGRGRGSVGVDPPSEVDRSPRSQHTSHRGSQQQYHSGWRGHMTTNSDHMTTNRDNTRHVREHVTVPPSQNSPTPLGGGGLEKKEKRHKPNRMFPHPGHFHQPPIWGQAQKPPPHQHWPPGFSPVPHSSAPFLSQPPPWPLEVTPRFPLPTPPPPPHCGPPRDSRALSPRRRLQSLVRPMVTVNKPTRVQGGSTHPMSLSLLTYNVLAQSLIEKNRELYKECADDHLQWENRKQLVWQEVTEASADVICFQEVEEEHYHSWFTPKLAEMGYAGVYKKRTGEHTDGCALFYRSSRLELVDWKGVEFQRQVKILNRDNIAIVAKLRVTDWRREKRNSRRPPLFCVGTTHLLFNPKAGDVKLAQLACLLAELHCMASAPSSPTLLPCLLCGDLNSVPHSPLLQFMEAGSLDCSGYTAPEVAGYFQGKNYSRPIPIPLFPDHINIGPNCQFRDVTTSSVTTPTATPTTIAMETGSPRDDGRGTESGDTLTASAAASPPNGVLSHPFSLSSAYPHPSPGHSPSTITTYHSSAFETVDYIHFTPAPRGRGSTGAARWGFHLLSRRALLSTHTLLQLGPQPHHLLPSDHLCLQANLQLVWR